MHHKLEVGLTSPVEAMNAYLEPYLDWIEGVIGCSRSETITLEFEFPFSHLVADDLLAGVALDRQCLGAAEVLRGLARKWELPPGVSPRMELHASRDRRARVTDRNLAWDPHWKETPIAIWLEGSEHAIVSANIPYVSYIEKGSLNWRQWVIVNRREAAASLNLLRQIEPPRRIHVIGGRDIALPEKGYNWDSIVLEPALRSIREDFEMFWDSESWFVDRGLPYRRGFLLYGPPGNGKTSVARVMACHPQVSAFSIDFSGEGLPNDALSDLFQSAEDQAPALVILEDLDKIFGADGQQNRTAITLPHLLSCLDGLAMQNGIVIVATANDPSTLDPAILKRPGRFDRLALFPRPSLGVRRDYLARLTGWAVDDPSIEAAARESDRLSFAQLREAYILAGQRSFRRRRAVVADQLMEAIRALRHEAHCVSLRADSRPVGFGTESLPDTPPSTTEGNNRRRKGASR